MSTISELSDLYDETKSHSLSSPLDPSHIRLDDLDEESAALIQRTKAQLPHLTPPVPRDTDPSLVGRVTLDPPAAHPLTGPLEELEIFHDRLETIAAEPIAEFQRLDFPHLALEAIKAGMAKEKQVTSQINGHIKEAEKLQRQTDLLLDLSAELTAYKENTPIPEKMQSLLNQLKDDEGIDLLKGDDRTLSKEKISELKSLSSAQVDKLRSNLQIIFTTKIQTLIQSIGSIMEILKDVIRSNSKLISTANRLPGH